MRARRVGLSCRRQDRRVLTVGFSVTGANDGRSQPRRSPPSGDRLAPVLRCPGPLPRRVISLPPLSFRLSLTLPAAADEAEYQRAA